MAKAAREAVHVQESGEDGDLSEDAKSTAGKESPANADAQAKRKVAKAKATKVCIRTLAGTTPSLFASAVAVLHCLFDVRCLLYMAADKPECKDNAMLVCIHSSTMALSSICLLNYAHRLQHATSDLAS